MFPIVISELKLRDVERQIPLAHLVERADDAGLENGPEAFNRVGVAFLAKWIFKKSIGTPKYYWVAVFSGWWI